MVFQKEPTPESSGNGLRLVDWWGPDGRTLAAVSLWWQEDSDVGGHGILIYRAETKRVVEPDLDALFSRSLRRECSLRLDDIPGFTESGELVVKVTSTGGPGSIIASALSLSADRTQVFRVPMRDRTVKSSSTGEYPWSLDESSSSIVYIKNATGSEKQYTLYVNFDGGSYALGVVSIPGGQTHSYDIRALRDGQVPDVNGNTIPMSASQGHVHWSVRGAESKALIGRVEQFNLANGLSMTVACGACCPDSYQDSWLTPGSVTDVIGDTSQFTSIRRDIDCYGGLRSPYPFYSGSWSSDNTSVSTVNSTGLTTAMGIGSTLIHSYYNADQWAPVPPAYNPCQDFYFSANTAGSAAVKPLITVTKGFPDKIFNPETVSLANLVNVT